MRRGHFETFRPVCPRCAAAGDRGQTLLLAQVLAADGEDIAAGILHCPAPPCRHEYPIISGIPVIVADLARVLSERATALLLRCDLDPALESLLGDAIGPDSWFDALRQVQSTYGWDSYADLDPEELPAPDGPRPGAARRCLDRLLTLAGACEPLRVLDLGCGAGRTSIELAVRFPEAQVLGLDLDLGLLLLAHSALRGELSYPRRRIGLTYDRRTVSIAFPAARRVDFWACDALALPFASGVSQLAAALNLLDCVPEPRRLLAGLADAVQPGGRVLLATPYDWSTRATPPQAWIGGHSQRAEHRGAGEPFLRALVTQGAHPDSVAGLSVLAEDEDWPWHTRLHDRSAVQYRTHLMALARRDV